MATSSIIKDFVVKDIKTYFQIIEEISNKPNRTVKTVKPTNLERGKELLNHFSFH